ncbi:KptA family-domain-containing protein [Fimicolochytrium jonesii]|uniref:KptA family-domain-containing protein n=1 Tax=Fimicolochytrium jonesii TaxID=1396493 RepID=UPI0022FEBD62|nr:KptA family-domain-containing protein [Fimicolochytrium jonesii]KAI8820475.1 KptA family-domain-containing protein [Fimicolochytrium jonesii]
MASMNTRTTTRGGQSGRGRGERGGRGGRGGGAGGNRREPDSSEVRTSKALSYVLRHGAEKDGIPMRSDGYVLFTDLVKHPRLRTVTLSTLQSVVSSNDKQRFKLIEEPHPTLPSQTVYLIRANQGHSLTTAEVQLTPITEASQAPVVIHGTYKNVYPIIAKEGLKPMSRQHIHFAAGMPGGGGVISGMRSSCDVVIYLDLQKALDAGVEFWRSENGVILSKGDKTGVIRPEFFKEVVMR